VSPENEAYYKSDKFGKVLQYLQKNPKKARLKEVKSKLIVIFENIKTIQRAKEELSAIEI
jgi:transcription-repair coupling factor (superfamily II helicase)